MADSQNIFDQLSSIAQDIQGYIKLKLDLFKLEMTERLVKTVSDIVLMIFIVSVGFFVLLFLSFAFAYWFGEMTGRWPLAFLMTAAFWVLLGLVILVFRKPLILDQIAKIATGDLIEEKNSEKETEDGNEL